MSKKISKQATNQKEIKNGINKLTNWAEKKGYNVFFESNCVDEVRRIQKEIYICSRQSPIMQLFGLAHECGHAAIENDLDKYKNRYSLNYKIKIEGKRSGQWSKAFIYQEIAEECEAWQKAEQLLNKLNIKFDKKKFDKLAADCVYTYIAAASG